MGDTDNSGFAATVDLAGAAYGDSTSAEDVLGELGDLLLREEKTSGYVDEAFEEATAHMSLLTERYNALRGKSKPVNMNAITGLVKSNWGKIATMGAAFGVPLGVADTGAFKSVLGVLSNFWPF